MDLSLPNLLLVLLAGWLAGWGMTRLGYPSVLGEIAAGILLGPPLLGLLGSDPALAVLANIGILLMMLYVGMEIDAGELGKASWPGLLAAIGGFVTPFVLAYWVMIRFGTPPMGATFVGIAAGVTSLTTKSRILVDLRLLDTRIAHVMMAGALISDTLSLIVFAGVLGALRAGAVDAAGIAIVALKAAGFFLLAFFLGIRVFPVLGKFLTRVGLASRTFHFTFVLLLAVSFGELAHLAGLHAILGAFLAGLFLRDTVLGRSLSHDLMGAVRDVSIGFLAPVFFVTAGFEVSLDVFRSDLLLLVAVIGVSTLGKIFGTAAFYLLSGNGWREGLTIGGGMNGRGAVEIIVAGIALEAGLISREVFSILVFMAIFTTATVPFLLKWGTDWLRRRGELVRSKDQRSRIVIVGAGPVARRLAHVLAPSRPVHLVDSNPARCRVARNEGLAATCGNAFQEQILADAGASDARTLISLTPNAEVNALIAQLARGGFLIPELLILVHEGAEGTGQRSSMEHLQANRLFGAAIDLAQWDRWIDRDEVRDRRLFVPADFADDPSRLLGTTGNGSTLILALVRSGETLPYHSDEKIEPGDELIVLDHVTEPPPARDRFDRLVIDAPVLDLQEPATLDQVFGMVAERLTDRLGVSADELRRILWKRERTASSVLVPGLAVPHIVIEGSGKHDLLIARSRPGIQFDGQSEPVHAVFVLVTTSDLRNVHLRVLSALAQVVSQVDAFEEKWRRADGEHALRTLLLASTRSRFA